jgi:hypothetical protein
VVRQPGGVETVPRRRLRLEGGIPGRDACGEDARDRWPVAGLELPDDDGLGAQETPFRVNVRWVTPLGEETASMS